MSAPKTHTPQSISLSCRSICRSDHHSNFDSLSCIDSGSISLDFRAESVKEFIFRQLNIIADAIRDYPLAGVKAFKKAAEEAIFHEADHSEIVEQYSETPQMTSLKAIQAKVVKVSKFSIEFSKFLAAMDTIYHHGGAVLQTAHHLSGWAQHLLK